MLGKYCFASMEMIIILQLYAIILQVNIDWLNKVTTL